MTVLLSFRRTLVRLKLTGVLGCHGPVTGFRRTLVRLKQRINTDILAETHRFRRTLVRLKHLEARQSDPSPEFQTNARAVEASQVKHHMSGTLFQTNARAVEAMSNEQSSLQEFSFRRTLVRLKQVQDRLQRTDLPGFRRTLVRLKPNIGERLRYRTVGFRRTLVRLKPGCGCPPVARRAGFRRTLVRLKRDNAEHSAAQLVFQTNARAVEAARQ